MPEPPHSSNSDLTSSNTGSGITAGPAQKFLTLIIQMPQPHPHPHPHQE